MKESQKRKTVHIREVSLDVVSLFDEKTIDEVIEELESIRTEYSDYTFLGGCSLKFSVFYDSISVNITRKETDEEYNKRQERNKKISESQKVKRASKQAQIDAEQKEEEIRLLKLLQDKYKDEI